jgi:transcriptional regulator with XRE-family HTH domain
MLHDALRLLRKFDDRSQTEMAVALGVSKSWISQIEAGNRRPTLELLEKYADVLKVPMSSILFFAEQMKDDSVSERVRVRVASKVLHAMKYIATRASDDDHGDQE